MGRPKKTPGDPEERRNRIKGLTRLRVRRFRQRLSANSGQNTSLVGQLSLPASWPQEEEEGEEGEEGGGGSPIRRNQSEPVNLDWQNEGRWVPRRSPSPNNSFQSDRSGLTSETLNTTLPPMETIQDVFVNDEITAPEDSSELPDPDEPDDPDDPDDSDPGENVVNNPSDDEDEPTVAWLAGKIAKIRLTSNVSDQAIEKMFGLFLGEYPKILTLFRRGQITNSYLNSVKPAGLRGLPKIKCAVKVREQDVLPDNHRGLPENSLNDRIFEERDLNAIPMKYIHPAADTNYTILVQEAYLSLRDIKTHFEKSHPRITGDSLKNVYQTANLGIDGIRESQKSTKKLIMISLGLDGCLYPWKVLNPQMGEGLLKTAEEQLG
jgi:hypothetical protein